MFLDTSHMACEAFAHSFSDWHQIDSKHQLTSEFRQQWLMHRRCTTAHEKLNLSPISGENLDEWVQYIMSTPDSSPNEITAISSEGRRFALVVGVNNSTKSTYLKPLLYAERDAHAIADVLRKSECNFTVLEPPLVGKEASTWAIMHAVTELIDKGTSQDFLLFYFSGHAKQMRIGENQEDVYFVTHDFEETKIKVMPDLHLSMSWLWKAFFQRAEAGRALLMLDCCYAGKMVGAGSNPYQVDIRQIIEDYLNASKLKGHQNRLRLILMATRDDATALELDGHGLMTRLVLRALRGEGKEVLDDEGRVDIASLAEYLTKEMQAQPPHLWVEGTSKPCILAHYPKQSARSFREAAEAREDALMTALSDLRDQITDRSFFKRLNPHQPFDQIKCEAAFVTDLNQEKVTEFFKRDRVQIQEDFDRGTSDHDQLRHFELLEDAHPTYGALLCFGLKPTKWLAGAFTRCTLWPGDARHSGWLDAQDYRGDLIKQFESSRDFLRKCLRLPRVIGRDERSEEPEIPVVALEEALANALVHREYMNQTSPVYVDVFNDRIEISNPGIPPEPMTLELLEEEHKSYPRNPQIARLFYLYGYVETVGSGIQRMQHALERAPLPSAKFELGKDKTFKVIFYRPKHTPLKEQVGVFISYSHADEAFVKHLEADLEDQGIVSLMKPRTTQPGIPDWKEISRTAIRAAAAVLLIASPAAQRSRYVNDELRLAEIYRRPIYSLWIAGTQWIDVAPFGWSGAQYIDARESRYKRAVPELVELLNQASSLASSMPRELDFEPRNPYKGLRAFTGKDATDFFGCDRLTDELMRKLSEVLASAESNTRYARLLAVIGSSGSGKSSVVMAGLLPRLRAGALPESKEWVYLKPMVPGSHPIEALTLVLSDWFPDRSLKTMREDLGEESTRGLHLLAKTLAKGSGSKAVLIVDQFEELFTLTSSEDERRHFMDLLVTATTEPDGPVIVLLTLRADFYDRPMRYSTLHQLIQAQQTFVLPMDIHDLREVIERPASLPDVQVSFEDDLVSDLLFEVMGQPGALSLLQFTLDQLFQRRSGHLLTLQAYNEIGGVKGALASHAESTYASLPSDEHRRLTRALFLRLIDLGMTGQDAVRRRAVLSEFSLLEATQTRLLQEVISAFTAARLLTISEIASIITIEVSNEALIREWRRLAEWLYEARNDVRLQQTISKDTAEWEQHNKSADRLYRGTQLKEAQAWTRRNIPSANEMTFLQASATRGIQSLITIIMLLLLLVSSISTAGWYLLAQPPDPAHVTTLNDHGQGSLRQAIDIAPAGSTITFDASLHGTILLTSGDLNFGKRLILRGPGAGILTISSNSQGYGILVTPSVSVSISSLAFTNSTIKSTGHGSLTSFITNNGTLTLTNCIVSNNIASGNFSFGGGIYNTGTLTLTSSTVSGNTASNSGGGIYNTGTLTLTSSTVSGNTASNSGGGIYNTGTLTLTSSTVSGNHAHTEPDILDHSITHTIQALEGLISMSKSMA